MPRLSALEDKKNENSKLNLQLHAKQARKPPTVGAEPRLWGRRRPDRTSPRLPARSASQEHEAQVSGLPMERVQLHCHRRWRRVPHAGARSARTHVASTGGSCNDRSSDKQRRHASRRRCSRSLPKQRRLASRRKSVARVTWHHGIARLRRAHWAGGMRANAG